MPAADFQRALDVIAEGQAGDRLPAPRQRDRRRQDFGHRHRHAQPCRRRRAGLQGARPNAAINIRAITTSEIKFSLLIDAAFTELAVRTLHSLYGLDKASP